MRKYLLLLFVLIIIGVALFMYLPYEKQISQITARIRKDSIVVAADVSAEEVKQAYQLRSIEFLQKVAMYDSVHPCIRGIAAYALGEIGDSSSLPILDRILEEMKEWIGHGDGGGDLFISTKNSKYKILTKGMTLGEKVEYVANAIRNGESARTCAEEITIINMGREVVPYLIQYAVSDTCLHLRRKALNMLSAFGDTSAIDAVIAILEKEEKHEAIRRFASRV